MFMVLHVFTNSDVHESCHHLKVKNNSTVHYVNGSMDGDSIAKLGMIVCMHMDIHGYTYINVLNYGKNSS